MPEPPQRPNDAGTPDSPGGRRLPAALRPGRYPDWLAAVIGSAIVLLVLLVTLAIPFLDERRQIATVVPQPSPLFAVALVELHPGQRACANEIDLLPGRQEAEVRVGTYGKPPAPLAVTLTAPGYAASIPVAATYVDNGAVDVPFSGPAKPLEGTVCIANRGHRKIALYASEDRTKSRSTTTVAGKLWPSNFDLAFFAARRQSLFDDAGEIMRRVSLFRAGVGVGLLWVLCVLFALGVPLASVVAVALARRGRAAD